MASKDPRKSKYKKQAYSSARAGPARGIPDIDKTRPGIFVTCPRNKERQAAREALELFDYLLAKVYPALATADDEEQDDEDEADESIEAALAREVAGMKHPTSSRARFEQRATETTCLLFFATPFEVDPVRICEAAVQDLVESGSCRYKCIQRLTPIVQFASSINIEEVEAITKALLTSLFAAPIPDLRWRIDFTSRSHNKPLTRDFVLQHFGQLAQSVQPSNSSARVDLQTPTHVLIVEAFKHLCGVSIVSSEWYEGPALEGSTRAAGRYRKFGIGSLADDLVKARARGSAPEQNGTEAEHVAEEHPAAGVPDNAMETG